MPAAPDEFSGGEVAVILAGNRAAAGAMLGLAWDLEVKLPGTRAAFAAGLLLRHSKMQIIALATRALDPGEARAAEAKILGRAGRLHLTVPLVTLLGLADRPGELAGLGPPDPWLARDLAAAAAANPNTTWCVTVTDPQGHATGHGCARPAPHRKPRAEHQQTRNPENPEPRKPGAPDGRDPRTSPGSPSTPPASPGAPAATEPGGCELGPASPAC